MLRLSSFVDAVHTAYPGSEPWYIGADKLQQNESALDRCVVAPVSGNVTAPPSGAQGVDVSEIDPAYTGIDDIVCTRVLNAAFHLWAPDFIAAENRLHALLIAINDVAESTAGTVGITEQWPQQGDITSGGSYVVVTVTLRVYVIASDREVVASAAPIGAGAPTETVNSVGLTGSIDTETLPPVDIVP